ncbi:MAG TPA: hypothetical protein PLL92_15225 [Alicycliphilus sp.]|nr:hypothetical protein [Alicycliphilus sp.]
MAIADGIRAVQIPLGSVVLVLQSPLHKDAPPGQTEPPAARALRERLVTRGEGPCALALRRDKGPLPPPPDMAATHGVALTWRTQAADTP